MKIFLTLTFLQSFLSYAHIIYFAHLLCVALGSNYHDHGIKFNDNHTAVSPPVGTNISTNSSSIKPSIIVANCFAFIDNFADAAASYTRCTIKHARPVTFCQHCVNDYVMTTAAFGHIMEVKNNLIHLN